jgi:HD-like signal output (HDOD) protein
MIKGLGPWVRKLTQQSMPVMGKVIIELNSLTGSEDAEINQLAEVILRDPNLTSHVLRVSNSVYYNPSTVPVTTISRAIVLIGLKGMRAVCISLLLIDTLLKSAPKDRVLQLIAQGLHSATQARNMVKDLDGDAIEEVFIAALLFNLGEMAYLACEKITPENVGLLSENPKEREVAMEKVLGTTFKSITRALAKHWKLGDTLEHALHPGREPNQRVKAVILAESLCRAAHKGWDSPQVGKIVAEIAHFTEVDLSTTWQTVQEMAVRAAEIALEYGAAEACPLIPIKSDNLTIPEIKEEKKPIRADILLQLNILSELTTATVEKSDVNTVFQMVVEGMHRGVGLDRVALAFIQNFHVSAKYVLGLGTETWRTQFVIDVGPYSDNIFTHAIANTASISFDKSFSVKNPDLYSSGVRELFNGAPCVIYVVRMGGRTPALFYGDKAGGEITKEHIERFRHFAIQAQICLSYLSQSMKKNP